MSVIPRRKWDQVKRRAFWRIVSGGVESWISKLLKGGGKAGGLLIEEEASLVGEDGFGGAAGVVGDDGGAAGLGFEGGEAEVFFAGEEEGAADW